MRSPGRRVKTADAWATSLATPKSSTYLFGLLEDCVTKGEYQKRSAIEAGGARNPRVSAGAEGARGNLDQHGRQPAQPAAKEQIEIPAFLRKHG